MLCYADSYFLKDQTGYARPVLFRFLSVHRTLSLYYPRTINLFLSPSCLPSFIPFFLPSSVPSSLPSYLPFYLPSFFSAFFIKLSFPLFEPISYRSVIIQKRKRLFVLPPGQGAQTLDSPTQSLPLVSPDTLVRA